MSLVIAIRDKDRIVLGADKQASTGGSKEHTSTKMWPVAELPGAIMGGVGSARASQIIQYANIIDKNLIDKSIDVVVDFFSPFNNEEVKRVLKDNGIIIKITPGNKYLNELRNVLKFEDYTKKEEIKLNFMKYFDIINEKEISKKYSITEEDTNNLLMMSPLKKQFKNQKIHIDEITIDNVIYVGVCKNEKE